MAREPDFFVRFRNENLDVVTVTWPRQLGQFLTENTYLLSVKNHAKLTKVAVNKSMAKRAAVEKGDLDSGI